MAAKPATLRGREFSRQNFQNYDFTTPFRGERVLPRTIKLFKGGWRVEVGGVKSPEVQAMKPKIIATKEESVEGKGIEKSIGIRVQGTEKQIKPGIQEVKWGHSETKTDRAKIQADNRETIKTEQKNTPTQAQKLKELFKTTEPLELAARIEVLARRNTENQGAGIMIQDTKVARDLQSWPRLTVETNRALEEIKQRVQVLEHAQPALKIVAGTEAQAVLMTGEIVQVQKTYQSLEQVWGKEKKAGEMVTQALRTKVDSLPQAVVQISELQSALNPIERSQLLVTYQALAPILGHEKAQNLIGQSVEKKVQTLNPTQKMVLAQRIINETSPEQLLEGLSEEEKWRVEIFVKKIAYQKETIQRVVVWEPGMRVRARKITNAFDRKFADRVEQISGAELVVEIGGQSSDEIGPIVSKGQNSGSGDQFRAALMYGNFSREDLPVVMGMSDDHPTLEIVEEEVATTREATDEEFHEEIYGQIVEIIVFAKQRAMVMLASLPV